MIELLRTHPFFAGKTIDSCEYLQQQGYCNANYLVQSEGKKYIVRQLLRGDIDRQFEYEVQTLAYEKRIAAQPLVFDEANGLMIFAFVEGVHKDRLSAEDVKALAETLLILHTIPLDKAPITLDIQNKTPAVLEAFAFIDQHPKTYVLCHNDLNPKNIFFTQTATLIDFEYAGINDCYFDLACVCVEFALDVHLQHLLLDRYFKSSYSREKLEAYKLIYKALVDEWFQDIL